MYGRKCFDLGLLIYIVLCGSSGISSSSGGPNCSAFSAYSGGKNLGHALSIKDFFADSTSSAFVHEATDLSQGRDVTLQTKDFA